MASFYIIAGSFHFINADAYLSFMPPYLPWHKPLIYISGFFEILFGIMFLIPQTRRFTSYLIIALLIAIFPANVHMAIEYWQKHHPYAWLAVVRLPMQYLLIRWAWGNGVRGNDNTLELQ